MEKEALNIFDAIATCDYLPKNKDLIISIFYDLFMSKKCQIYITLIQNKISFIFEKIFVVRYFITVNYSGKNYEVPLLIYFPKLFPAIPPNIFIEKSDEIGVNPKSTIINKTNLQILTKTIKNWNLNSSNNIQTILDEILIDFSTSFPVYKLPKQDFNKIHDDEDCVLISTNVRKVSFEDKKENKIINNNRYFLNNNSNNNCEFLNNNNINNNEPLLDFNFSLNNNNSNLDNIKYLQSPVIIYSDEKMKLIYIKELIITLHPKIKSELLKLKQQENKLNNYKFEFSQQIEQVKNLAQRKGEIINRISSLANDIVIQINSLKSYLEANSNNSKFEENNSATQRMNKFVSISDSDLLNIIAAEATLDEFLIIIKKAYEKKIFTFEETIKISRRYSREMFNIKYYKEKLIRLNSK